VIDNAQKYTSRPPEIDISLSREGQYAVIAIRDNGIGIPQHVGKKIFEPFFRVPTGNVYNTSGHGLGLSFVKQVMALHDGNISFVSSENGTIFYLKFKVS
jgi:two-component system, OmpR family, phosphate regulon sensor histidine kinase PhoR